MAALLPIQLARVAVIQLRPRKAEWAPGGIFQIS